MKTTMKCARVALAMQLSLLALAAQAQLPPPPVSLAQVVKLEYDAQGNPTKTIAKIFSRWLHDRGDK